MVHLPNNKECAKNKCGTYVNCNNYECDGEHGQVSCTCPVAEGRICFVGGDTTGNFPITPPVVEEKQKCPSCGKEGSLSLAEAIRINAENGRCFECANSGNASPVEEKCSHGPTIGCPSCPNSTI